MPTDLTLSLNLYQVIVWGVTGLVAGFLASRLVMRDGLGFARELVIGVVGGILGNIVFGYLHVTISVVGFPILSQVIVAFFGALFLVLILRIAGVGRGAAALPSAYRSQPQGRSGPSGPPASQEWEGPRDY